MIKVNKPFYFKVKGKLHYIPVDFNDDHAETLDNMHESEVKHLEKLGLIDAPESKKYLDSDYFDKKPEYKKSKRKDAE
jgi:hypothetical protein